jgi:hypothetical protein
MNQDWVKLDCGGGITSQFMLLIQTLIGHEDLGRPFSERLYVDKGDSFYRLYNKSLGKYLNDFTFEEYQKLPNWWDGIFEQSLDVNTTQFWHLTKVYGVPKNLLGKDYKDLSKYRSCVKRYINFKKELLDKVEEYSKSLGINENTLAVHLRTTDMNYYHPHYGIITVDYFLNEIKKEIEINSNISNIYIASESQEDINYVIKNLNSDIPIVFTDSRKLSSDNIQNTWTDMCDLMKDPLYWQEVFLDILLLSKCKTLIGRISNIPNTAMIVGDGIERYICINEIYN